MHRTRTMRSLGAFVSADGGTTAIEYSLIAAGISIAILAAVNSVGSEIMVVFYDKLTNIF